MNQDSERTRHHANLSCRATYHIRVEGELGPEWAEWFEGATITPDPAGDTLLCSPLLDQAGLFGVLKKVRDLGMPLISINRVETARVQDDGGSTSPSGTEASADPRSAEASVPGAVHEENT